MARPGRGLNWYLAGLVLLALVPTLVAAAIAVVQAARGFEAAQSLRLVDTARTLARVVEAELKGGITLLDTLAVVPHHTATGVIDPWALAAERQIGGRLIEEVFSTGRVPEGDGLSPQGVPLPVLRQAVLSARPAVSDLFVDPSTNAPHIAIAVAIARTDEETRLIALVVPPSRLVQLIRRGKGVSSSLVVAVTDSQGRFVARSIDPDGSVGVRAPSWSAGRRLGLDSGTFRTTTIEGVPHVFGFQRLRETTEWVVTVGEPLAAFQARATGHLINLGLIALAAIAMALLAAAWLGRKILRPVKAIAARARLIATGEERPPLSTAERSDIAEFEALRVSLERSEAALRDRAVAAAEAARSVAESERRQHLLATTGALVFWRLSADGQFAITGWKELTGSESPTKDNWLASVHPDDVAMVKRVWGQAITEGDTYEAEYRIRVANGSWLWIRARGTKVPAATGEGFEWVGLLEDIDAFRAAEAQVVHMASHDALTGLANRAFFRERLAALCAQGRKGAAVLCIGLDRFKAVNDTLGHSAGDAVLVAVASRLQGAVAQADVVVRLGGDEFAIIQSDGIQPLAASLLAERLMAAVAEPIEVAAAHTVTLTASVGIALLDEAGAEESLKNADLALDRAKEDGRDRFCFFEPAMDARMKERHRLERDLRRALADGQFLLNHQPIVAVASGALVGFEALLRWRHPERGMVSPADFIPMAEETGLIVPIGRWVLERACEDAARWGNGLKVAVNVSPKQLADRDFPLAVERALSLSGLAPNLLELEITENALMADVEGAMSMMLRLKSLGCCIAMDDFGTGYSSLGYLRTFPFDKVKIDRSFVQDLASARESGAIVRAVTGLCGSLGITSTAEGVETKEQLALLQAEGCDQAQGYLFGRPAPVEDLPALFARFGLRQGSPPLLPSEDSAAA
ncbi:bifunctional diguanylate cyclase/phosphodiesterase [Phreatobacter oligotrophus]|uniref:Diguanylate cyclase (GGDEF)-like protein n=1 Tax=Phreatobacter oligotrophus TaxID=1122261 RepID=A0A2T4YYE5_9HYPH|nr:EAL domain-containing protein [Phreatobacter oligotrophus]PTM51764.1 diguanylate cyclase (GGDEF)-like protein [Phreatobacter oligotrophus]